LWGRKLGTFSPKESPQPLTELHRDTSAWRGSVRWVEKGADGEGETPVGEGGEEGRLKGGVERDQKGKGEGVESFEKWSKGNIEMTEPQTPIGGEGVMWEATRKLKRQTGAHKLSLFSANSHYQDSKPLGRKSSLSEEVGKRKRAPAFVEGKNIKKSRAEHEDIH